MEQVGGEEESEGEKREFGKTCSAQTLNFLTKQSLFNNKSKRNSCHIIL